MSTEFLQAGGAQHTIKRLLFLLQVGFLSLATIGPGDIIDNGGYCCCGVVNTHANLQLQCNIARVTTTVLQVDRMGLETHMGSTCHDGLKTGHARVTNTSHLHVAADVGHLKHGCSSGPNLWLFLQEVLD
jgi:hypothetical protein